MTGPCDCSRSCNETVLLCTSEAQNYRKDRKKQKNSAPPLLRITGCNLIRKPKLPPLFRETKKKSAMVTE
ncbi:hypothetical protein C0J52_15131 [Blattella germanica]|nr:hypothetical protein C0J52_15131 [Blattella germanica]